MDWYYSENNQQKGPVSDAAIAELAGTGVIHDATLVWHVGMPTWQPYGTVKPSAPPALPLEAGFCSECGREFGAGELVIVGMRPVCATCKQNVLQRIREGTSTVAGRMYGGFWLRVAATIIDTILLMAVNSVISLVLLAPVMSSRDVTRSMGIFAIYYIVSLAINLAYEAWFLVNKGATPGKMVLGLRVIPDSGLPITWGLAIGRYFAKMVSGMVLCIGFLMVAWDEQKRGLHDRICDTRVVKK